MKTTKFEGITITEFTGPARADGGDPTIIQVVDSVGRVVQFEPKHLQALVTWATRPKEEPTSTPEPEAPKEAPAAASAEAATTEATDK